MYTWAKYQSIVRCCSWLSLLFGSAALSCAQSPSGNSTADQPRLSNSARSYGGWVLSQPTQSSLGPVVQRASYYQQLDGSMPSLPNFSGSLPAQPISDLRNDGGALVNSLSDMPVNAPPPQQFDPRDLPGDPQTNNLPYESFDPRSGASSGRPLAQINSQYANNLGGTNGLEVNPPGRLVPVTQAAFQSGQNSVMPPPHQYLPQQQYPPQQPVGGSTHLRQAREVTTGLPYVTPAPAQRYPTSPYMGRPMFMNAAYQTTVNYPNQVPGNSSSVLPQNLQPNPQPIYTNTAPGVYPTAYPQQCAPTLPPDGAVGAYVPPTVTPNWNPNMYSSNNSGYRPVLSLGQEKYNVVLGRGILGQPTTYVPGQYVRNFLRYISP